MRSEKVRAIRTAHTLSPIKIRTRICSLTAMNRPDLSDIRPGDWVDRRSLFRLSFLRPLGHIRSCTIRASGHRKLQRSARRTGYLDRTGCNRSWHTRHNSGRSSVTNELPKYNPRDVKTAVFLSARCAGTCRSCRWCLHRASQGDRRPCDQSQAAVHLKSNDRRAANVTIKSGCVLTTSRTSSA